MKRERLIHSPSPPPDSFEPHNKKRRIHHATIHDVPYDVLDRHLFKHLSPSDHAHVALTSKHFRDSIGASVNDMTWGDPRLYQFLKELPDFDSNSHEHDTGSFKPVLANLKMVPREHVINLLNQYIKSNDRTRVQGIVYGLINEYDDIHVEPIYTSMALYATTTDMLDTVIETMWEEDISLDEEEDVFLKVFQIMRQRQRSDLLKHIYRKEVSVSDWTENYNPYIRELLLWVPHLQDQVHNNIIRFQGKLGNDFDNESEKLKQIIPDAYDDNLKYLIVNVVRDSWVDEI